MAEEERDDALTWDGDDDRAAPRSPRRTTAPGHPRSREAPAAAPVVRSPPPSERGGGIPAPVADAPGLGNVALVALGLLGGIYVLWSVGWIVSGLRVLPIATAGPPNGLGVEAVGYTVTMWLAVLAPLIWFGSVFVLTRTSPSWLRFVLLVAGAIVLLPWPFLMLGTVGR